jgi:hypothetical protein
MTNGNENRMSCGGSSTAGENQVTAGTKDQVAPKSGRNRSNRPNRVSTFDKVANRTVQGGRAARVVRHNKLGCLSVVMGLLRRFALRKTRSFAVSMRHGHYTSSEHKYADQLKSRTRTDQRPLDLLWADKLVAGRRTTRSRPAALDRL